MKNIYYHFVKGLTWQSTLIDFFSYMVIAIILSISSSNNIGFIISSTFQYGVFTGVFVFFISLIILVLLTPIFTTKNIVIYYMHQIFLRIGKVSETTFGLLIMLILYHSMYDFYKGKVVDFYIFFTEIVLFVSFFLLIKFSLSSCKVSFSALELEDTFSREKHFLVKTLLFLSFIFVAYYFYIKFSGIYNIPL